MTSLARVAGGAAVEAGEHAAGATHLGGVDAAHGAGDGEAGADVAQGLASDPRTHRLGSGSLAHVEISTGRPTQSSTNLKRGRTSVTVKDCRKGSLRNKVLCFALQWIFIRGVLVMQVFPVTVRKWLRILPELRPGGCRCSSCPWRRSPSCWSETQ